MESKIIKPMKIYNELLLKFEKPDWSTNTEFCVIDAILESRYDIILMLKSDIVGSERASTFGRQDTPNVEQIVRAAIFKEMRGMDYRELEYAPNDSRICATFIKLEGRETYIFQYRFSLFGGLSRRFRSDATISFVPYLPEVE